MPSALSTVGFIRRDTDTDYHRGSGYYCSSSVNPSNNASSQKKLIFSVIAQAWKAVLHHLNHPSRTMQTYILVTIALAAISTAHAKDENGNSTLSRSRGAKTDVESVVTYTTLVSDWEACSREVGCETATSVCIRHSKYYAQCKPVVLPSGDLCGQADGTNDWLYDHCPADEKCDTSGTDFRCVKPETRRLDSRSTLRVPQPARLVGNWEDCSAAGSVCKVSSSTCVKHSNYYSQCMPAILPTGGLCGQNDGTTVWKYDAHCSPGETCQATGLDFHCRASAPSVPTTAPPATPTQGWPLVNDWEDCSQANTRCKIATSTCVKHSDYFSQCMPTTLPTGALCGQDNGTSDWRFFHCIAGETCKANGKDYHCTNSA
ncbi:unnamed protein product [Phytophthora fragariaefolia]|uniref:Unnamed protein product n=1 Tax=Phytophthora fragariaefolia TaxID=1490495 RepID=A0A9W7CR79_9STRA|nr:unnamed protein product [Phytophthora fragariaefolia]